MNCTNHADMSSPRRLLWITAIAVGLVACTHNDFMPNVIQLTPNGTPGSPAIQSTKSSFTLIAVEDGYTGQFSAETIAGKCWVVRTPVVTSGAFTVDPQGLGCGRAQTDTIAVKDMKGNSAVTYIRSN